MPEPRHILHVDMDAFFASVEQLDQPHLRGKPVLVGHDGPRGVVAAASYEARVFGCRSAQPIAVAKRLCPHALIVPGRHDRYSEISHTIFTLFERFSPAVEPLSIDEAFIDVTGSLALHGPVGGAAEIARKIKLAVRTETGLTASVGVAPNKFLAKLASDLEKPDGLVIIRPEDIDTLLPPLPITRLWGVGPKSAEEFAKVGIKTIGDLRNLPSDFILQRFGSFGEHCLNLAHGRDDRTIETDDSAKSISHEQTFETDVGSPDHIRTILFQQVEAVAYRLRKHTLRARRVALKIRFGEFQTISRSRTLPEPTDQTRELWDAAAALFDAWARENFRPVRLIGMAAEAFATETTQLPLFPDPAAAQARKLDQTVDRINEKFGQGALRRAGH
jgi:DNA polymerase IV